MNYNILINKMTTRFTGVSYCVGVYNEEKILLRNLTRLEKGLQNILGKNNYEIVVVDNQSIDNTASLFKKVRSKNIRTMSVPVKGYGIAQRTALKVAKYDRAVIGSIDMPFGFSDLKNALDCWDENDIVFGSKAHPGSVVFTDHKRRITSKIFSFILRLLFGLPIKDTQGILFVKRKAVLPLLKYCKADNAFFTAQLAIHGQRAGLSMVEVPVKMPKSMLKRKSKYKILTDGSQMMRLLLAEFFRISRKMLLLLSAVLMISLLIYTPVLFGFFQQDEWNAFGRFYTTGLEGPNVVHFTPLTEPIFFLLFKVFGLNYLHWAITSLLLQAITVYLVYNLARRIFGNKYLGLLTAAFFTTSASGFQVTSWIPASVNTHLASIFAILSLIFAYDYFLVLSLATLLISLLFKEIAIALFFIAPLLVFLYNDNHKKRIVSTLTFAAAGVIYFLVRVYLLVFSNNLVEVPTVAKTQSINEIVSNLLAYPINIVTQSIIPPKKLIDLGKLLVTSINGNWLPEIGTTSFDLFIEKQVVFYISLVVFLLVFLAMFFARNKSKKKKVGKAIIFGFVFVVLNSFVYALSPGRHGVITLIDSRNLYFPAIGIVIVVVSLIWIAARNSLKRAVIILIPFIAVNILWLNESLVFEAETGRIRYQILRQIKLEHPDLPKKAVLYTESDSPFYGTAEDELIMPFQNNFGFTFMVWYQESEDFPDEFIDRRRFLRGFTGQGYKEINGRGFGYFRDFDSMIESLRINNLSAESIIAYRYIAKTNKLIDISEEIRASLDCPSKGPCYP